MFTSFFDGVKNFFTANVDEPANGAEKLEETNILVDKNMETEEVDNNRDLGSEQGNEEQGFEQGNEKLGSEQSNKELGNGEIFNNVVEMDVNEPLDKEVKGNKRSRDKNWKMSIKKRPRPENTKSNSEQNNKPNNIILQPRVGSNLMPQSSIRLQSIISPDQLPKINRPSNNIQNFVEIPLGKEKLDTQSITNLSGKKRRSPAPAESVITDDTQSFFAKTQTYNENTNRKNVSKKILNPRENQPESITAQPIATISAGLDQLDQIKSIVDTLNEIVVVPANSFTTNSLSIVSASLQQLETTKILLSEIENIGTSQSKKRRKDEDSAIEEEKNNIENIKYEKKSKRDKNVRKRQKDEQKPKQNDGKMPMPETKPLQETGKWLRLLYETTVAVGKKKEQEILEYERIRSSPVVSETTGLSEISQSLELLDKSTNLFWQIFYVLFDSFFTVTDAPRTGLIGRIQNLQILCDKILKMLSDTQDYKRRDDKKELILLRELCGDITEDYLVFNIGQVYLQTENDRAIIKYLPTFLIDDIKNYEEIKNLKNNVENSKDEYTKKMNKLMFNSFLRENFDNKIFKIDKLKNIENNFLENKFKTESENESFFEETDLLRSKLVKKIEQKMGTKCFNKKLRDIIEKFKKIKGNFDADFNRYDIEDDKIKINKEYIKEFEKNAKTPVFFFCTKGSNGYRQEDEFVTLVEQDASKIELNRQNYYMAVNYAHYWLTYFKIAFKLYRVDDLYADRYNKKIDFIIFFENFSIN